MAMRRFEVVRDDGDVFQGIGYSYAYYDYLPTTGHFWQVTHGTGDRRWIGSTGQYPRERADLAAIQRLIETGSCGSDKYWLLRVNEVTQ